MWGTASNTFSCTGEGGYPERFIPYADNMITQVATGLFGVREATIARVRIVEFKYAQGAKPGLGGHLLRKCDGEPGWITLWRGYEKLQLLLRGAKVVRKKCG